MMRVLFTMQPGYGHWHPLVPLARALEEKGHEVIFASTPGFCRTIEANGFRCFRVGADETPEELEQRRELLSSRSPKEQANYTVGNVFLGSRVKLTLPHMLDIFRENQIDILVHDNTEFAGCVVAQKFGVPHATFQVTAAREIFLGIVSAPLMRLCESVGLPAMDAADLIYRYLLLWPRPPLLWGSTVSVPPTRHSFRHISFNQSGAEKLPAWVDSLEAQPIIYATLGTVFNYHTHIFEAMLEALRSEPVNVVLAIGRDRNPADFGPQPPNVHIERYIPQSLLLPLCEMVVTHGGSGTLMDTLSVGLPSVLVPVAADQQDNSDICRELGVGIVVEPDERTPEVIRQAVREVLTNPRYRQAAQQVQKEMDALPGLEYPVALLERLAAEREPLLN